MVVILKPKTTEEDVEKIISYIKDMGLDVMVNKGVDCTVLGLLGDTSRIDPDTLMLNVHVDRVMRIAEPFKKASKKFHPEPTVVNVGDAEIGKEGKFVVIAGPCSVETEEQILDVANSVKESGAKLLRGGAFKPRTSPYSFQGLEMRGLELLEEAREQTGLPIVTEIMSPKLVEEFDRRVDIIQVGARNMQNFDLLKELGQTSKPILLKRGLSATIEEWLMSAEYIMAGGNPNVILCERGIRTFETYTRNTLDLSAIPAVKRLSHLPVIVDPSHSAGMSWMVEPLSLAAMAVGADGLIIEVHNNPAKALCDGAQSLDEPQFASLMKKMRAIGANLGKEI
ncbi:MAG TPA: 3-deoxy-7-phosphoheptulonate synthase [Firmicutes bacterium]|nr:3-deoxy-7-phosphoheptulonate synthase [Bacillota bacterium]